MSSPGTVEGVAAANDWGNTILGFSGANKWPQALNPKQIKVQRSGVKSDVVMWQAGWFG